MLSSNTSPEFTLGFNFDDALVDALLALPISGQGGRVAEVFGALPDSPMSSARPLSRIPDVSWATFAAQAQRLLSHGIHFNYLINTSQPVGDRTKQLLAYVERLLEIGVTRITVGTTELATLLRLRWPELHLTMSITRGVKSAAALQTITDAGCDACYLDGVFVNRNIPLLKKLIAEATIDIRLYANMSCISGCPVVRQHYDTFAQQDVHTVDSHDGYFAGCSLVKLRSPVEWIQMPWIRPEDIAAYSHLRVSMFKLSDRLAPTPVLAAIATAYVVGQSPDDLFTIIERSGVKYQLLGSQANMSSAAPYRVKSAAIPDDFVPHFLRGECTSQDAGCPVCITAARAAIDHEPHWQLLEPSDEVLRSIPAPLLARAALELGRA